MFYYLGIQKVYETQMVVDSEYDAYSSRGVIDYQAHFFIDLETWGVEFIGTDNDDERLRFILNNCITTKQYQKLLKPITSGVYYIGDSFGSNGDDLYCVYKDFATGKTSEVGVHNKQPDSLEDTGKYRPLNDFEIDARQMNPTQIPYEKFDIKAPLYTEKYISRNEYFQKKKKQII